MLFNGEAMPAEMTEKAIKLVERLGNPLRLPVFEEEGELTAAEIAQLLKTRSHLELAKKHRDRLAEIKAEGELSVPRIKNYLNEEIEQEESVFKFLAAQFNSTEVVKQLMIYYGSALYSMEIFGLEENVLEHGLVDDFNFSILAVTESTINFENREGQLLATSLIRGFAMPTIAKGKAEVKRQQIFISTENEEAEALVVVRYAKIPGREALVVTAATNDSRIVKVAFQAFCDRRIENLQSMKASQEAQLEVKSKPSTAGLAAKLPFFTSSDKLTSTPVLEAKVEASICKTQLEFLQNVYEDMREYLPTQPVFRSWLVKLGQLPNAPSSVDQLLAAEYMKKYTGQKLQQFRMELAEADEKLNLLEQHHQEETSPDIKQWRIKWQRLSANMKKISHAVENDTNLYPVALLFKQYIEINTYLRDIREVLVVLAEEKPVEKRVMGVEKEKSREEVEQQPQTGGFSLSMSGGREN